MLYLNASERLSSGKFQDFKRRMDKGLLLMSKATQKHAREGISF